MRFTSPEEFQNGLLTKSPNEVMMIAVDYYKRFIDLYRRKVEDERIHKAMYKDYQDMKSKLGRLTSKNNAMEAEMSKLIGELEYARRLQYSRTAEDITDLDESNEDPIDEDAPCDEPDEKTDVSKTPEMPDDGGRENESNRNKNQTNGKDKSNPKKPRKPKKKRDLSGLPERIDFKLDVDALNKEYGVGGWTVSFWENHKTVERVRAFSYQQITYTPVISYVRQDPAGHPCKGLYRVPFTGNVIPKSMLSSSLATEILCDKYKMFLPYYRLEHDEERYGFDISRKTMTNWEEQMAFDLLLPIYQHLQKLLSASRYQQCDETYWKVISDERSTGTKSFIWAHRTSELSGEKQIVLFCYEQTRGSQHLIDFYQEIEDQFFLTSDAYSAYNKLERIMDGLAVSCGCFMHSRRRFFYALLISLKEAGLKSEDSRVKELPEYQALEKIRDIYRADEPLKSLPSKERHESRQRFVKPKVDSFFDYLRTLDMEDPRLNYKLKDAISYTLNQETQLRQFLDDGNIPIDNGACERNIKPVALIRRNSLFSFSERGAESSCIILSLIETAKSCGADPYYYLKYALEKMSLAVYHGHDADIEDLLPWADAFQRYHSAQIKASLGQSPPPTNEKPKTPHIKFNLLNPRQVA